MKTADPELMRAINRYHVIDTIRRDGPIARVEIAERTELSPATVSAITAALIEEGLVDALRVASAENGGRGRPRVLLGLNGAAYHVVGVKLSAQRIGITVTDARGEPLASVVLPVKIARQSPGVIADLIEDGVRQCVSDAGMTMERISGIGIGLPGVIDARNGISHWSPVLGASPEPLAQAVERRLGARTLIENDASLVALAEHWFGYGRGLQNFAVVTVENTIGMGLITEGRLYRGARGVGPELGHVKVEPGGAPCRCGQRGCLDAYASDWGILRQAEEAGLSDAGEGDPSRRIAALARRALEGEEAVARLFRQAGAMLGLTIANIVNLLNPPRVILTGEGLRATELLRAPLLSALEEHVLPALREVTEIMFHPWGDEMWARGAAAIVLRRIYEAPWNNAAMDRSEEEAWKPSRLG
ncbi:ROK family transcriptional regulator [Roseomonas marmotae]|uniref:ROK family transcriptional regulator n=1 Tax=Roseomonas marmotae TaxID=2768161 RepID=A0ABS3KEW1_9PROT|nr:ROK family transcriptional regulator [Roseomonas marmotae]MBO1075198.1 ROK family transcriptional regulator [Roseomonas marmotae]QTI79695.1 ROK family transcriptional regulator [Roseomonas marmotae]